MSVANNTEDAKRHHAQHGDMDGQTCLLSRCALHYPDASREGLVQMSAQELALALEGIELEKRNDARVLRQLKEFAPLTMSLEEWDDCTLRGRPSMIKKLKAEVLEHAAQLAQAQQEIETLKLEKKSLLDNFLKAALNAEQAEADLASLRARLHEIEQERAGYRDTVGEPAKVVMFKGVEFVNETPHEITLEPEGPMRMRIRVADLPRRRSERTT